MIKFSKKLLILIDGSFYLYRSYYAFTSLINSNGELTGAIYGVINMLINLIKQYNPSHIAIIFDAKGNTFRNKLFNKYKSNRPSMPNNLYKQILPLHKIITAIGLPLLIVNNVEADDVIGTLALQASKEGMTVLISTGDKDITQLVNNNIIIINSITKSILDKTEVINQYGILPELIVDFLALIGDLSDNIPGIPGVGKKTALSLLNNIGNLKKIYNNLSMITKLKLRGSSTLIKKMIQYQDIAFLSYKLAKLNTNVNLNINYNQLIMKTPDIKKLKILLNYYEFKQWIIALEKDNWII